MHPNEYTPPKKLLEFSRKHQEDRLTREQQEGIKNLTEDEVDLEVWNLLVMSSQYSVCKCNISSLATEILVI